MAWVQTASGLAFSLSQPDPLLVDFENDVAPALGKLARFIGHTNGDIAYSVAQHCVLGAESLYDKTGSKRLAAIFLLHDSHEAYIGDLSTPTVLALDEVCQHVFSPLLKAFKAKIDWAIFRRAGVTMPDDVEAAAIKQHDTAMMNAERFALKKPSPHSWGAWIEGVPAAHVSREELEPWPANAATAEWLEAFDRFIVGGMA